MTIKLKSIVSSQLPDFVREDYDTFTAFVEAYYEYLDSTNQGKLIDLRDINNTVDSFIDNFKAELNIFGENSYPHIDKVLLLRKIKEFYSAKGTEASYKFLFKILFNKSVDISYPWNQVLKASDGKWKQDISIFINVTAGDINIIPGNKLTIQTDNTNVKIYAERIELVSGTIYEVFIDKHYYGSINIGDTITFDSFSGTLVSTISDYVIESKGSGFKVGDMVEANTISGSTIITALLKVVQVDSNGGIDKLSVIKYGANYSSEFFTILTHSSFTNSSRLALTKQSILQYDLPDTSYLDKYTESGYIIKPDYMDSDYSEPSYVGTLLREFLSQTSNSQDVGDYALIRFKIGALAKYQGYYISNDGFLDDIIKIQDSYYYQKYSYLLTVDEKLENYKPILKSCIHAAGVKVFGEYQIQNVYAPVIEGNLLLNQYQSSATFRTINKSIGNEFIVPSDLGGKIKVNPYDLEGYFVESYNPEQQHTF